MQFVLADDFTGAAALGGSLRARGRKTIVLNGISSEPAMPLDTPGVVVLNTATRDVTAQETQSVLETVLPGILRQDQGTLLFRVDSTMRGNIATSATLGRQFLALASESGLEPLVFVSIANPEAGRTVENGQLRVLGQLASTTELSRDPTWCVTTSEVGEFLFGAKPALSGPHGSNLGDRWALIDGNLLDGGADHVSVEIRRLVEGGHRTFIVDGRHRGDSETLARAIRKIQDRQPICILDSGPVLQALLARKNVSVGDNEVSWRTQAKTVLVIAATPTQNTYTQLEWLRENSGCLCLPLLDWVGGPVLNADSLSALESLLGTESEARLVALHSKLVLEEPGVGPREFSEAIAGALSEVARVCLGNPPVGLILVGGETSLRILKELGAAGIRPGGILEPLMPFGAVSGGPLDGMPVITKGGLIGNEKSLHRAVMYLRDVADPGDFVDGLATSMTKGSK